MLAYLRAQPRVAGYSQLLIALGEPGIKALDHLVTSGDVLRPQRGRYVAALPTEPERPKVVSGVSNRTVCAMLAILSPALATAMKRGLVARNVAQLVDRPALGIAKCPRGRGNKSNDSASISAAAASMRAGS